MVGSLDGLLLSGGSDLDPGYYGEEPSPSWAYHPRAGRLRDGAASRLALRRGIPVFGICRGMQVLNVALGGTLYQDLPSQLDGDVLKHRQETPKWQPTHEVEVRDGSYLAEIMGRDAVKVNSYHHQGIKDLAEGLVVSAPLLGRGGRGRGGQRPLGALARSACSGTPRRCAAPIRSSATSSRPTSPPPSATPCAEAAA